MRDRAMIAGTGSCLPDRVLTNAELERMVDTSDEWIVTRTGIRTRHIAGSGEFTSRLAAKAAERALASAGLAPTDIGLILVATMTSEMAMPSCACLVQKELGAENAFAFDINAACSGFVYALDMADKYIRADHDLKVLVIGAETLSSRTNWQDRNTCVLFGDGAGACVVRAGDQGRGLMASRLFSDGRLWELLSMHGPRSMNPDLQQADNDGSYIRMVGRDVFKYAVRAMEESVRTVLADQDMTLDDVDLVIPHQANIRILKSLVERLAIPPEKIFINVDKYGNTSAASVPLAMDEANRQNRLRPGDVLLVCAFGGGFTWGSLLLKW